MPRIPAMNLSPEATPWGRAMQQKIEDLERSAERRVQAEANTNQGQNGTLTSLAKQIRTLDETVASLVTPAWTKNTATGFAVPSPSGGPDSGVTASATLTVPPNAAKCSLVVIADAFVEGLGTGEGDATIYLSITEPITSVAYTMAHIPENSFSSVLAFAIGGIDNVTPGETLTFSALLRTGITAGLPANVNNYLTVSTMATFQR